jgi:ribosomal-protein-serine acetyltransferase
MVLPETAAGYGITLRRWRPIDVELLHRAVTESVKHLRPWMEWVEAEPVSIEERLEWLRAREQEWRDGGDANYAVLDDGKSALGACGLHRRRGPRTVEIGYWTHPAYLRRGVATSSARLLTDLAFRLPSIDAVEIHHDKANGASRGVPMRLGYEFIGEEPDDRQAPAEVGFDCTWRTTRLVWLERAKSIESGARYQAQRALAPGSSP